MKTILRNLALLSLPLAVSSCNPYQELSLANARAQQATPTPQPTPETYSFDNFGQMPGIHYARNFRIADFNGDGTPDIAIIDANYRVMIFENKIPQKNK